ncbi:MAG: ATP-binding protein [Deltaproteobacteria bacterium]|nr:ATP-binding protein [Deltaproteobacteria bacterium]
MKMKTQNYPFELDNDLSELKTLNKHLSAFGRNIGVQELCISEINICLDELFTNIVLYGFNDDLKHKIKFIMTVDDHILTAAIEDDGVPFNPLKKEAVDLPTNVDDAKIGGLGIHITKKLVDTISYKRKRGINRVTVRKNIGTNEPAITT